MNKRILFLVLTAASLMALAEEPKPQTVDPTIEQAMAEKRELLMRETEAHTSAETVKSAVEQTLNQVAPANVVTPHEEQSDYQPLRERATHRKQEKPAFRPK